MWSWTIARNRSIFPRAFNRHPGMPGYHSRPQRPHSFWSAPRIATSGDEIDFLKVRFCGSPDCPVGRKTVVSSPGSPRSSQKTTWGKSRDENARIQKTQLTGHVFNLTSDRFCLLLAIIKNRQLPRKGSPAISMYFACQHVILLCNQPLVVFSCRH